MFIVSKNGGHIKFGDAEIAYLEELLNSIDISILDLTSKINAADIWDVGCLCDRGEYFIGVGFCAMQRYLFDTLEDVKLAPDFARRLGPKSSNGVWFHHCATEAQIQAFLRGNDPPRFGDLIGAIEKIEGFDCGTLSDIKKTAYRNLNDFTHGGATQVKARNSREEVVSSYLPEHVLGIINSSTALCLLAAVAIAAAVEDNELGNRLLERYQEIYRA